METKVSMVLRYEKKSKKTYHVSTAPHHTALHRRNRTQHARRTSHSPMTTSVCLFVSGVEPPPVPDGHYAWFLRTIRYTDTEVLATAGLDGLMFIKFFEMCATLFTLFCIFGVGILLPINFTSENDITDEFDKMSMSNIPQKSDLFWAHLIIAYVFCGFFYYLAYHLWQDYLNYRHQFLAKWGSIGGGHTVLIHYLPKTIRTDAALLAYFQKIFPGVST